MERHPVQSSNIVSIGYDIGSETLEVEFKDGGIYQYIGVPHHLYEQFSAAPSIGQFFHYNIKNLFPYARVG